MVGAGTILELVLGIGVIVVGTVGDEYKYLSPCTSLVCSHGSSALTELLVCFSPISIFS